MTIHPLGKGAIALSLTPDDLAEGTLRDLDAPGLLAFLRQAGVPLPPRTHIEAYARSDALLLLIQPPRRPRHYIF